MQTGEAPTRPVLLLPQNQATDQATSLLLVWNQSPTANSYILQVSTNDDFHIVLLADSTVTDTMRQISGLNLNTTYYWRIYAKNSFGQSPASVMRSFSTVGTAPNTSTLINPFNGATGVSITPTLFWSSSKHATKYWLQVSNQATFSAPIVNDSSLTDTTKQLTGLPNNTKYYWRVFSKNTYGTSLSSSIYSFTTLITVPTAPVLLSPVNYSINQITEPTFTWNPVNSAESYSLEVSLTANFSNIKFLKTSISSTNQQITGLTNNTKYYWRVSARNTVGISPYSPVWEFTTLAGGQPPTAPMLSFPSNGSINQSITKSLVWAYTTGADTYTLQVAADASFTQMIYYNSNLSRATQQIPGLKSNTKYYWRLSGSNSFGTSPYSNVWNFTTAGTSGNGTPCPSVSSVNYAGKNYNTVQIGGQCWLKENLDIGTKITMTQNQSNNSIIEKYCYNDEPENCSSFGGLYQWGEVMQYVNSEGTQGICPTGWHIPTYAELQTLSSNVSNSGNAVKAIGEGETNGAGTNSSGFSALLVGCHTSAASPYHSGVITNIWSSTEYSSGAMSLFLNSSEPSLYLIYYQDSGKNYGFSVRCLKN